MSWWKNLTNRLRRAKPQHEPEEPRDSAVEAQVATCPPKPSPDFNTVLVDLRGVFAEPPSEDAWSRLLLLLDHMEQCEALTLGMDYATSHLEDWPDELRCLEEAWLTKLSVGEPEPRMSLARSANFSKQNQTDAAIAHLCALGAFEQITCLDLSHNQLSAIGLQVLLRASSLSKLTKLDLSNNIIDDRGARTLASSPLLGRLTYLNLSYNRIGEQGFRDLSRSEYFTDTLELYLDNPHYRAIIDDAKATRRNNAGELANQANVARQSGMIREAIALYRQIFDAQPHYRDTWLRALAECYQELAYPRVAGCVLLALNDLNAAQDCFIRADDKASAAFVIGQAGQLQNAQQRYACLNQPLHVAILMGLRPEAKAMWEQAQSAFDAALQPITHAIVSVAAAHCIDVPDRSALTAPIEALHRVTKSEHPELALQAWRVLLFIADHENDTSFQLKALAAIDRLQKQWQLNVSTVLRDHTNLLRPPSIPSSVADPLTLQHTALDTALDWENLAQQCHSAEDAEHSWLKAVEQHLFMRRHDDCHRIYTLLADMALPKSLRYASLADQFKEGCPPSFQPTKALDIDWDVLFLEEHPARDYVQLLRSSLVSKRYNTVVRHRILRILLESLDPDQDDSSRVKHVILDAAPKLFPPLARRLLRPLTSDPDPVIRVRVLKAAAKFRRPWASAMIRTFANDSSPEVREALPDILAERR